MTPIFKSKKLYLLPLRVIDYFLTSIGFAAQFIFHILVSVVSQLMVSITRYIVVVIIRAKAMIVINPTKLYSWVSFQVVERNNVKWIKVEILSYSLLLGKRVK